MSGAARWLRFHAPAMAAFVTMAASAATTVFVWYIWSRFDTKTRALTQAGSEAAGHMGIATTVMGTWILPALIGVSVLALVSFVMTLRSKPGERPL